MENLLIVESENDKYFIEALISHMQMSNIEVSRGTICQIDDYECLGGLSEKSLIDALNANILQAKKRKIKRLGIILDQDKKSIDERVALVNSAIGSTIVDKSDLIKAPNKLFPASIGSNSYTLDIGLCLTNVDGKGELETVLKAIKKGDSVYADCLNSWQKCLETNGKSIKVKDFDKFWVQVFIRYDACTKKEQNEAGKNCNTKISMQKDIWNFDAECLSDMRSFLNLFTKPNSV